MKLIKILFYGVLALTYLFAQMAYGMDTLSYTQNINKNTNDALFNTLILMCNRIATNGPITQEVKQAFMKKVQNGTLPGKTPQEYYNHCIKQLEPILKVTNHQHYEFACTCAHVFLRTISLNETAYAEGINLLLHAIQSKNIGLFVGICKHLNYKNISLFAHDESTMLHLCAQYNFAKGPKL